LLKKADLVGPLWDWLKSTVAQRSAAVNFCNDLRHDFRNRGDCNGTFEKTNRASAQNACANPFLLRSQSYTDCHNTGFFSPNGTNRHLLIATLAKTQIILNICIDPLLGFP